MSAPAFYIEAADNLTLTFRLFRYIDGFIWNIGGSAFEAFNTANWANYANATTRASIVSGKSAGYTGSWPSVPVGAYFILIDNQRGGSPSTSDAPAFARLGPVFFNGAVGVGALPGGWWW